MVAMAASGDVSVDSVILSLGLMMAYLRPITWMISFPYRPLKERLMISSLTSRILFSEGTPLLETSSLSVMRGSKKVAMNSLKLRDGAY